MSLQKALFLLTIGLFVISCGPDLDQIKSQLSFKINAANNVISNDETLILSLENNQNHPVDSVQFMFNEQRIKREFNLSNQKLGKHKLQALVFVGGELITIDQELTILYSSAPTVYTFTIVNEYPHDINAYTQGLEFYNGELYESTGQYGKSQLRKIDHKTGAVLQSYELENSYFGEGLTVFNENIYQLTWQESTGFVYDVNSFERKSSFKYGNSKEGWGICNDGKVLYKSDGTEKIWILDPETLSEQSHIEAYHYKGKTVGLNELEWINGKIYANRYQLNGVAIIDPNNGAIEGVIDFSPLKDMVTQHKDLDVLNGIAFNSESNTIFVTGKYWDKLFEVQISEK